MDRYRQILDGYKKQLGNLTTAEIYLAYSTSHIGDIAAQVLNQEHSERAYQQEISSPYGAVYNLIRTSFGTIDDFVGLLYKKAYESLPGWLWVVYNPETARLHIQPVSGVYNPILDGTLGLFVLNTYGYEDVEKDVLDTVNHVNWTYVNEILFEHVQNGIRVSAF